MSRKVLGWGGAILSALFVCAMTGGFVLSAPGTSSDGNDSAGLDIASIGHTNTDYNEDGAQDIVLWADTHDAFDPESEFFKMEWKLDFDENATASFEDYEACVLVQQNGSGGLQAVMYKDCDSGQTLDTANVVLTPCPDPTHIEFFFQRDDGTFRAAGLAAADTSYNYHVESGDLAGNTDRVPDASFATHADPNSPASDGTFTPATCDVATPTPAPTATPTPVPTASPTVAPTASPTAAPTASPTASPTLAPTASPTTAPTASPTAAPTSTPAPVSGSSASDPNDTSGNVDVQSIAHADGQLDGDAQPDVRWTINTFDPFSPTSDFYKAQYDFDFNGDGVAAEACMIVEQNGSGGLRAVMFPGCGSENSGTQDAVVGSTSVVVKFPHTALVEAGMLPTATSYSYRVTVDDLAGNHDTAPDSALAQHTFGQASASPTPAPTSGASPTPAPTGSASPTPAPTSSASPTPTPAPAEESTDTVDPGGTASSDDEGDGATPDDPVETDVTVPAGGEVTIVEGDITSDDPSGFTLFGQEVDIDAPDGTPDEPLTIIFTIDASVIEGDIDDIAIFRDGVAVPDCTSDPFDDDEDACVESRETNADGDAEVTISTVHASTWNFALPQVDNGTDVDDGADDTTDDGSLETAAGSDETASGGSLPQTGAMLLPLLAAGGGLLYAGIELRGWARRRRGRSS